MQIIVVHVAKPFKPHLLTMSSSCCLNSVSVAWATRVFQRPLPLDGMSILLQDCPVTLKSPVTISTRGCRAALPCPMTQHNYFPWLGLRPDPLYLYQDFSTPIRTVGLRMKTQTIAFSYCCLLIDCTFTHHTCRCFMYIHNFTHTELVFPHSKLPTYIIIFNSKPWIKEQQRGTNPKKEVQVFSKVLNKIHIC